MAQGNDILKVFVAKKDGIVLTAGKKLKDLKVGEVAVFDTETNLSVANFEASKRFYLAINQNGKIVKSPNRWIDKDNIKAISVTPATNSVNKKVTFKDFTIHCGKNYSIRLEATNELTKLEMGTNHSGNALIASSKDCSECGVNDKCVEINPIPVVYEFMYNKHRNKYVKVDAIARANITGVNGIAGTVNKGTILTEAQLKLINKHNLTKTNPTEFVKVDLVFEAIPLEKGNYAEGYMFPRETEFNVVLSDSFIGNGILEINNKTVIEQGAGYDIKNLEISTINPYSHSRYSNYGYETYHTESFADVNEKYVQIAIRYGHKTEVTSHLYDHTSEVIIALPSTSNIDAFKNILKTLNAVSIEL